MTSFDDIVVSFCLQFLRRFFLPFFDSSNKQHKQHRTNNTEQTSLSQRMIRKKVPGHLGSCSRRRRRRRVYFFSCSKCTKIKDRFDHFTVQKPPVDDITEGPLLKFTASKSWCQGNEGETGAGGNSNESRSRKLEKLDPSSSFPTLFGHNVR